MYTKFVASAAMVTWSVGWSLSAAGEPAASEPTQQKASVYRMSSRVADDGETMITVIRDADGNVVAKAATDPETQVLLDDSDPIGKASDQDVDGVAVSLVSSVASSAQAVQKASELDAATVAFRKAAVGLANTGPQQAKSRMFAADCISISDEYYWKGCYERRHVPDDDPSHWYILDASWAAGHHEGRLGYLDWAYTANRYFKSSKSVEIVRQRPTSEISASQNCTQREISLEFEGVGVADNFSLCPEKIRVGGDMDSAYAIWDGHSSDDQQWVAAEAMSVPRMANDSNNVLTYTIKVDEDEVG